MFADYEAYIKCQGQVDQLFMVRAACYRGGGMRSSATVVQWEDMGEAECAPVESLQTPHGLGMGSGQRRFCCFGSPATQHLNQPSVLCKAASWDRAR